jgi:putative heme-binding domain-containing protein
MEPLVVNDAPGALQIAEAAKIPLVRRFIARRLVDGALAKREDLLPPLVATLGGASDEVRLDLLVGAREALKGQKRRASPEGWAATYAKLARSENAEVREQAMYVALVFGDPQALVDLRKLALDAAAPIPKRVSALEALIERRPPELAGDLHALLADKEVRRAALRGLAALPHEDTPRRILAVYPDLTPVEKQDAVATLAARKESALELLHAIEAKRVPRTDVSAYVARQLFALGDDRVTARLREVWGDVRESTAQKKEQLKTYKSLLTPGNLSRGDLANGRAIYRKSCQQCHKLYGEGGDIGPDLTGSNRGELDYLLANLVDPSAEVAQNYRLSTVATSDGRVLTGIVAERSPTRLILQTATDRIVLAPDDIESLKASPLSIMPEGQLETLTKEQVRDLIAYLMGKSQVDLPKDP